MTDTNTDPNVTGEGYTQVTLPTQMLIDMGRRLRERAGFDEGLTKTEKEELLSAIMRAIG